jgi:outer membrane receptor protein involved in Fe transport
VNADDLRASGQNDVAEVLREIPALTNSGTISDSIERGGGGVGQATLDLRGLGSERTLVLVNGRRHVSGVEGEQTVDIATIPSALVESVEVLTGGASAVYGADAVTGVVNFKLRGDFEGADLTGQYGISDKGDGATFTLNGIVGKNFADGRGNIVFGAAYDGFDTVKAGARSFTRDNGQFNAGPEYGNIARRFQQGDINSTTTPNFAQRFSVAAGRFPYGFAIPTAAQFASFFPGVTPTTAEQALIDRAANAPSRSLASQPTFAISSGQGLIARADFEPFGLDLNRNGIDDCDESYIGNRNNACYVSTPEGGVRPFRDGLIASGANQFGGDGSPELVNFVDLIPKQRRYNANLLGSFEFSPAFEVFAEAKYVRTETRSQPSAPNSFYDFLFIAPDNPYIPAALRPTALEAGGLRVARDFFDVPNISNSDRDTYRAVVGARGELSENLRYEVSGNYGRTDDATTSLFTVIPDRFFASIDAVQAPNGQIVCRSNTDPTPYVGSEFFPVIGPGFFTFRPGDGTCRPTSLFNGENSVNAAALDFFTEPTTTRSRIEQMVFTAQISGDTGAFLNLPGGAVQFALGAEYREEKSRVRYDPLELGLLPANSPAGAAGTFIGDIDDRQSLTFDGSSRVENATGKFDVKEIFGELRIPLLADVPFAEELAVEGAARYSDYSTIGGAFTWSVSGIYAPVRDVRVRGTYSKAIRAPNIFELFSPQQGTTFRPIDPCDQSAIDALTAAGDPNAANRRTNCAADVGANFTDPLTARFAGSSGGNPDLEEETATTYTVGAVLQPRFLPGLTISADYYDISIKNAIAAVSAQDILDNCYDSATYPNQYCELFDRGPNGGLTFLRQTQLNFGKLETAGVDASIGYRFELGSNELSLRATANWVRKLNQFFDPGDPTLIDPELKELGRPEWSGVGAVTWTRGPVSLTYRLQYLGAQTLRGVEREDVGSLWGPEAKVGETFVHDIAFNFDVTEQLSFFGGVNNVADKEPFANASSYPVSPVGRFLFLGARARF